MKELVIGCDGFIGSHLLRMLPDAIGTTALEYDLLHPSILPPCDIGYICAGVNGFQACEGSPVAYRANVDGTLATCKALLKSGAFVVWISSCAVEWADTAYSRQKSLVEIAMLVMGGGAIIRAGRATPDNVEALCRVMLEAGRKKTEGVILWNVSDVPYRTES